MLTGTNVVTSNADNWITYKFDGPATQRDNEAMSWAGDSGGPALIWTGDTAEGFKIGGVNNSGDCCSTGMEDNYARLAGGSYEWIIANLNSGTEIPFTGDCS